MKNLLILGSLPESDEDYRKYEIIIKIGKKYFDNILSPIDTKKFKGNDQERFDRAVNAVKNADFIIGELSSASTGMGIEIGIAYELKTPIIILAKKGSKISGLIKGNKFINEIIFYENLFEIEQKLNKDILIDKK